MSIFFELLCASLAVTNAQNEEMFYYYDCEYQSDWLQDTGSYDPYVHTYTPVQWRSSGNCPRATRCLQTANDAYISRIISTVGFHSIHLQIDAKAVGVDSGENEWCIIQYKTAATNWINTNIVQSTDFDLDFDVFIPDNDVYNNQESFKVKIGIDADAGGDNCYFDNLKLFGIPYTETPTLDTNHPTKNPSRSPSVKPTLYPTKDPSNVPTKQPTSYPTSQPTKTPTSHPTLSPFVDPTTAPIIPLIAKPASTSSESEQNTLGFTEYPVIESSVIEAVDYAENKDFLYLLMVLLVILCCLCAVTIFVMCLCFFLQKKRHNKDVIFVTEVNSASNDTKATGSVNNEAIVLESADNKVTCEGNEANILNLHQNETHGNIVPKTPGNIAPDEFEVVGDYDDVLRAEGAPVIAQTIR